MKILTPALVLLAVLGLQSNTDALAGTTIKLTSEAFMQSTKNISGDPSIGRDERAARIQAMYDTTIAPHMHEPMLHATPKQDLHWLFEAASNASFYNPEGSASKDAAAVLRTLGSDASDRELRELQGILFQARKFSELDALVASHSTRELDATPMTTVTHGGRLHSVLYVSNGSLTTKQLDIARGPTVVVIAHPLCHFTKDAVAAIEREPQLASVLASHSVWISPVDRNMDYSAWAAWSANHPAIPISVAYTYSGWPEIDEWGTPTFYFFDDGHLIGMLVGWPKGGRMNELKTLLGKIGLDSGTPPRPH